MNKKNIGYLLILPGFTFYLAFHLIPIIGAFYISFFSWRVISPSGGAFVGLENYINLFSDRIFLLSLKHSVVFVGLSMIIQVPLALLLAVLLGLNLRLSKFFRGVYFVPLLMSFVVVGLLFNFIFSSTVGTLNNFLRAIGLDRFAGEWLGDPKKALYIIILVQVWKEFGLSMLLFVAGLQGIPNNLYESAKIDGANAWQCFRSITIPLLKEVIAVVSVLVMIISFKVFALVYTMTAGGPFYATEVLGTYLYSKAFTHMRMGYASSIAGMLFLIVFSLAFFQSWVKGRRGTIEY